MILHIPHSSTKLIEGIDIPTKESNIGLLTDWYADELFYHPKADKIIFEYSRLVTDVERFPNDSMEKIGKGKIYDTDAFNFNIDRTKESINKANSLYEQHHYDFASLTNQYLSLFPYCVIIDCHTFNNTPLPWEDKTTRPDICIGCNNSEDIELIQLLKKHFKDNNLSVLINFPYSGSILPNLEDTDDIISIMIEVNKRLYLDDKYNKSIRYTSTRKIILEALDLVLKWEEDRNGYI